MTEEPITTKNRTVTNPDGHTYSVFDMLTDFCTTVCPVCGNEKNAVLGAPLFKSHKIGEVRRKLVQIPMRCGDGHTWYFRITNFEDETVFAFTEKALP